MVCPKVSVIIPAYNADSSLSEAIQSVLDQSYANFELLVVDDASTHGTRNVVDRFDDHRINYIVHDRNRGAVAARRTGVQHSSGEIIALLDQDDLYHPDKLGAHVTYLARHPEVGFTYNNRFVIMSSAQNITGIWQAPESASLQDLVCSFPFAPSDMILRREWALRDEIWDDSYAYRGDEVVFNGAEFILCGRLALAGCRFANVGRALNYRRYIAGRVQSKLAARCEAEHKCQQIIFSDPRCPDSVRSQRSLAFRNIYLAWAYYALVQEQYADGQAWILEATRLDPSIVTGQPCLLLDSLVQASVAHSIDLEANLRKALDHLPTTLAWLSQQYEWAAGRGHLIRGSQSILWGRSQEGEAHFARAIVLGSQVDERFIGWLTHQLQGFAHEFGESAAQDAMCRLSLQLECVAGRRVLRRLMGNYWVNRAFRQYRTGDYEGVPSQVARAVANNPSFLANRGVLAIFARSIFRVPHESALSQD